MSNRTVKQAYKKCSVEMIEDYKTAKIEAENLVRKLHEKHYGHVLGWRPEEDLTGLMVQLNQMTHGLVRVRRAA